MQVRLAAVLAAPLIGCLQSGADEPTHDGKVPGELLGSYAVVGKLVEDECGAELLGAQNPWNFAIKLSRFQRDLYWLNGSEAIVGELAADDASFQFSTRIDVPIGRGRAGCIVTRNDAAEGVLSWSPEDEAVGFKANLSFRYQAKNGADCPEFIGVVGGVTHLPCGVSYALSGSRLAE